MRGIIKILTVTFLFLSLFTSCEESVKHKSENVEVSDAYTFFAGDPAVDGCGWLLIADSVTLSPDKLDSKFHKDSLKVRVKYKKLSDTMFCAWRNPGYTIVELLDIVQID